MSRKRPPITTDALFEDVDLAVADIEGIIGLLYLFSNVSDDVIAEISLSELGRVGKLLLMPMMTVTECIGELRMRLEEAELRLEEAERQLKEKERDGR